MRTIHYCKTFIAASLMLVLFYACKTPKDKVANDDIHVCTSYIDSTSYLDSTLELVGNPDLFWPDNIRELKVEFLDGDVAIQEKVINTAKEWEKYCSMRFSFGKFPKPDITISFKDKGSSSYIGTDSRKHRPSMNFGWFDNSTSQSEYNRVVLHEFGHALGFYHEHQNDKDNPIIWNKTAVNKYYKGPPNNWTKDEINNNIYLRYGSTEKTGTAYDPLSIMVYGIPKEFTSNGYHVEAPDKLSANDKTFIRKVYP